MIEATNASETELRAEVRRLRVELDAERARYDDLARAVRMGLSIQVRVLRAGDQSRDAGTPAASESDTELELDELNVVQFRRTNHRAPQHRH